MANEIKYPPNYFAGPIYNFEGSCLICGEEILSSSDSPYETSSAPEWAVDVCPRCKNELSRISSELCGFVSTPLSKLYVIDYIAKRISDR